MRLIIITLSLFLIVGCTTEPPAASETQKEEVEENKPSFAISSFTLKYEEDGGISDKSLYMESYKGEGIVSVLGDPELTGKIYLVFVEINKVSDGRGEEGGIREVIVSKGIGKFYTTDWNYDKNNRMERPVYEARIVGYLELKDYQTEPVRPQ